MENLVPYPRSVPQARLMRSACLAAALSLTGLMSAAALADEGSGTVLSQTGSNDRSQTGSNGRSQTGSNGRSQTGSNGRAVISAAMGAVEGLIPSEHSTVVVVLGQEFPIDAASASTIGVGDYVLLTRDETDSEPTLQKLDETYVAGVSPVVLVGVVNGVDVQTAKLTIGGATVDYSSQLSLDPGLLPASGALYETVGIQPASGGSILAGLQYDGAIVSLSGAQ